MAAITPSTVYRESLGSLTLHIATFAATADNADTWASGIQGIIGIWANANEAPGTQTNVGAGAVLTTASSGLITLLMDEDNQAIKIFVVSRS